MKSFTLYVITFIVCSSNVLALFPFQDPKLPWDQRVDDLVARLTLEEVANQSLALYEDAYTTAVPRLGIKPYVWITECVRGQELSNTTAFPHSIGLAASWSKELLVDMTEAISSEVRAQWNSRRKMGIYKAFFGLNCFSPVINIARHPLWGRIQETYGECPFLSGSLAQSFVRGLQGNHSRYVKVGSCCKHFDAYAGPENIPSSRLTFNTKVSMRDLRMTFLPAFKMCIEGGTYSVMCSYNSVNGIPACAQTEILTNITRNEWGFKGYVVSDDAAIVNMMTYHKYTKYDYEAAAISMNAGVNLDLGDKVFYKQLQAYHKGLLTQKQLRDNIKPLIYMRMKLGEFDPENMNPYANISMSEVQSPAHRALAVKAAQKTFTLLKNDMNALPLKANISKLAIIGPFANSSDQLFGDYSSNIVPKFTTTVWQGLRNLSNDVSLASGCDNSVCANYNPDTVAAAVKDSKVVIVALGTGPALEAESNDRATLALPGHQLDLLKDAVYYANGAKVILLLFSAGPLDVTWAKFNPKVHAIMECFFSAQATGLALYNTLLATSADAVPAGRLPITWPAYLAQIPPIVNYDMQGQTYRYFKGEPLYPFGYGLSYTTFEYTNIIVAPATISKGGSLKVYVTLKNTGLYDADEVTQVYISWPANPPVPVPKIQLVGFTRTRLIRTQSVKLSFEISNERLSVWMDDKTGWGMIPGKMMVYVGGQQPNQRTMVPSQVLTASVSVKI